MKTTGKFNCVVTIQFYDLEDIVRLVNCVNCLNLNSRVVGVLVRYEKGAAARSTVKIRPLIENKFKIIKGVAGCLTVRIQFFFENK